MKITASTDSFICIVLEKSNVLYVRFKHTAWTILWDPFMDSSFFLNNVGDTVSFNSVGKMSHIFGP